MPELKEGNFCINFGIVKLTGKLSEVDRQCAWKLYTEIATRVAVSGKRRDDTVEDFNGEVIVESFASLYSFFKETREIMKEFPVGKLNEKNQSHLGNLIHDLLADVLRPFLERWQADFRAWWENQDHKAKSWFEVQEQYPQYVQLLEDWKDLRKLMRTIETKLCIEYKLQKLN